MRRKGFSASRLLLLCFEHSVTVLGVTGRLLRVTVPFAVVSRRIACVTGPGLCWYGALCCAFPDRPRCSVTWRRRFLCVMGPFLCFSSVSPVDVTRRLVCVTGAFAVCLTTGEAFARYGAISCRFTQDCARDGVRCWYIRGLGLCFSRACQAQAF